MDLKAFSDIFPITKEDIEVIQENNEEYLSCDECNVNQFD